MKRLYQNLIIALLVISILIPSSFIPASASAGTIYESESNSSRNTADRTYDDYDNYGAITSSSDEDWWVVSFAEEGMVNFWLGNIPAGCNYDIRLAIGNSSEIKACSVRASNTQEIIKCHVEPGVNYYVKISSEIGSSSSRYWFRAKWYDSNTFSLFTNEYSCYDSVNNNYYTFSTRNDYGEVLGRLYNSGYLGQEYLNNSASDIYGCLPSSTVFVYNGHSGPGVLEAHASQTSYTWLTGNSITGVPSTYRSLESYSEDQLDNVISAILLGCSSAGYSEYYGSLVDTAYDKGAYFCIGWEETIYTSDSTAWLNYFFEYCEQSYCISYAVTYAENSLRADQRQQEQDPYYDGWIVDDSILNYYTGFNMPLNVVLG